MKLIIDIEKLNEEKKPKIYGGDIHENNFVNKMNIKDSKRNS